MNNLFDHRFKVSSSERNQLNKHNSFVVLFTGLSGSGKSTLANSVEKELYNQGIRTFSLDGDNIRKGVNSDLGFSPEDRSENLRRVAHISKLLIDAGVVVLASFIAPYAKDREYIRAIVSEENYIEVYVSTSLEECERRDPKGLYKKARQGFIMDFTGISAPYETPVNPDVEINTEVLSLEKQVEIVFEKLERKLHVNTDK